MTRASLQLLLSHADDHRPALDGGLAGETTRHAAPPAGLPFPRYLRDRGRDPNDLVAQRWGLIVPEGQVGERLEAIVRPLVEQRRDDQGGHAVRVYRVPAELDAADAAAWHRAVYLADDVPEQDRPFYQLILGDLDQVPLALQQVQAVDGAVGRLAFPDERGYEAYVAKLLRWEHQPAPAGSPRALFFTTHDGTHATRLGYQTLVTPAIAIARRERDTGGFAAGEIVELGDPQRGPTPDELFAAAAAPDPAVLLSVSHGLGAPSSGWATPEDQRRLQGAMNLGPGEPLAGDAVAGRAFLPGGLWCMVACFSAGTPDASVYQPWLAMLEQAGERSAPVEAALRGLPRPGEPPFVARLPAAALANPDGPLAFIGHVDLAWSYAFQELDSGLAPGPGSGPGPGPGTRDRPRRFTQLLHHMLRRDRVGVAVRVLVSAALAADTELLGLYSRAAMQQGAAAPAGLARLGHLWMLRHDLLGYVLLGDPAARLPIQPPARHAVP